MPRSPFDRETLESDHPSHNRQGSASTTLSSRQYSQSPTGDRASETTETAKTSAGSSEVESEQGFAPVLKNRNFLLLWIGQVFSQLADKVYLVLAIALIASHFQAPNQTISGWVSAIMVAFTIPAVLLGSIAGVYVDRWSKKGVLVVTNLLRGGLVLVIPALLWIAGQATWGGLPVGFEFLLGITLLVSAFTQFFAPAEQAAIPLLVKRERLLAANSLYTTTMMASVIIGFAIGEPALAAAGSLLGGGELGKEMLVGGGYAIAGMILIAVKTQENPDAKSSESSHVWQDIKEGVAYLGKNRRVRSALIQLIILFSIFAALAVLAVRLAEIIPNITSSQFGFLLAAGGVGMAVGAGFLGNFGQRLSHRALSLYGSIGMAVSLAMIPLFTDQLFAVVGIIVLLGIGASVVGIPMQTTIQSETPEEMRGKVFGLQNNAVNIALSLPLALAGVAETIFGLDAVFLGLAAIVIAGGMLSWYISDTRTNTREKAG
jgi:MFS family permease